MAFDIEMIKKVYGTMAHRIDKARELVGRPLTLSEKILYSHLWEGNPAQSFTRGKDYVDFAPDRVACQDATAQMALLQFMMTKYEHVSVEHLLSGHGIEHLFEFVCLEHNVKDSLENFDVQDYMAEDITGQKVIQLAMDKQHPIAIETIELFSEIYAAFIGNLALITLPYGGIYITGGIARHVLPFLQRPEFIAAYQSKGRMSELLAEIPIHYILNQNANLLGAGYYLTLMESELSHLS